ncbi:MAG: septum formation initiator family protein [Bacilli bacterium]
MKKTIKEKKRLFMISLIIIGLIASLVSSVSKDWVNILENNSQINEKTREYETLLLNEKKLKSEVTKLQDSEYVARFAKEKYMYSSDGETIIRMD